MVASIPGQTIGVGLFTDFLLVTLPFSRVELTFFYLIATLLSGLSLPRVGALMDSWGERRLAVAAAVGVGLALLIMYGTTRWGQAVAAGQTTGANTQQLSWTGAWLALAAAIMLCFFMLRLFGQGFLGIISRNLLGRWFVKKRARVTAVTGLWVALAFAGAPFFMNILLAIYGTPSVLIVMGLGWSLLFAGIFYLLTRSTPEACRLLPDNEVFVAGAAEPAATAATAMPAAAVAARQAIRTHVFWMFSLAITLQGILITGFSFHLTALGAAAGYTRATLYGLFPLMALASVVSQFVMGFLSERFDIRVAYYALLLTQLISGFGLLYLASPVGLFTTFIGLGISIGAFNLIMTVGFAAYFGRAELGAIQGINMRNIVIGTALAPWFFALTEKLSGSYDWSIIVLMVLTVLWLALSLRLTAPPRGL